MNLLLLGGGALLLLALASGSGGSQERPAFVETVILDGPDSDSGEWDMVVDAITAKVSPFDEDVFVVFYNNSESASDPQLRADINASAKEAGIRSAVHVYGPASGYPAARHYSAGTLKEELPAGTSPDALVDFLDDKAAASAGRQIIAHTGRQVIVAQSGRKMIAHAGSKASKHMMGMSRGAGVGTRHMPNRKTNTLQARAAKRGRGYPLK